MSSTIVVRKPDFDFTDVPPRWGSNLELVHTVNAQGMIPAYIEPYLIKVLRMARQELDPVQHPTLIEDIDAFIKQEAQHYKLHASLNKVIRESGYDCMEEFERAYEAEYEEFLERPLEWQLAYCEGFEASGSSGAAIAVDGSMEKLLGKNVDPRPLELWKWHMAEEYEHRTVVFQTYQALYGHRPLRAWFVRVRGFLFCSRHLSGHINALKNYLVETDRARMLAEGGAAPSKKRTWLGGAPPKMLVQRLRSMLHVLSPFYDPATIPPPKRLRAVLGAYE